MPTDAPYSISDLAGLTGLSVRTIRYYLAQGLIPASGESGPGAHYGEGHLARLRLVKRLQQQHLPLAEIRAQLAALSDADVTALVNQPPATLLEPPTSALDYVRSVLAGSQPGAVSAPAPHPAPRIAAPPSMPSAAAGPATPAMPAMRDQPADAARFLRRMATPFTSEVREAAAAPALPPATLARPSAIVPDVPTETTPPSIERSQWERLSLGPNLELHVRRPLSRLEQKRVERLITIARQVLKEEQP